MSMVDCAETTHRANEMLFDAWAQVYDTQSNPLLQLEERFLEAILPDVRGKSIVDAGCGTGRWLERCSAKHAGALVGIDSSERMLAVADSKNIPGVTLYNCALPRLPLPSESADVVLSSFTLSYVDDLEAFASEASRVLRPGCDLLMTDMHPQTAAALGWRRGIRVAGCDGEIRYVNRSIASIVTAMTRHGLHLCGQYEPAFGDLELLSFSESGKEAEYERALGLPAIFLLHFKRMAAQPREPEIVFRGVRMVLGANETVDANLEIESGRISCVAPVSEARDETEGVDLSGLTVFPGLINAHDHLEFSLFPRLGKPPYGNCSEWANDIQDRYRTEISVYKQVPLETRLWWGAIRNLLCGVTTVCHHNPHHPTFDEPGFPIRTVTDFGWAHSLAFQADLRERYEGAVQSRPFILHACEGIDADAHSEFEQLNQMGVMREGTVLVHGLGMDKDDIAELNRLGGAVIRCPSSNKFLFDTVSSFRLDQHISRLAIGSDSPLTASGDLLDELRFCREEAAYPVKTLFELSYRGAPQVLGSETVDVRLIPGRPADFFAVASDEASPAERLCSLTWRDVELVVIGGSVSLVSDLLLSRLPENQRIGFERLVIDGIVRWIKAPVSELWNSAAEILGANGVALNGRQLSLKES